VSVEKRKSEQNHKREAAKKNVVIKCVPGRPEYKRNRNDDGKRNENGDQQGPGFHNKDQDKKPGGQIYTFGFDETGWLAEPKELALNDKGLKLPGVPLTYALFRSGRPL
jgi:hypothetical protein